MEGVADGFYAGHDESGLVFLMGVGWSALPVMAGAVRQHVR